MDEAWLATAEEASKTGLYACVHRGKLTRKVVLTGTCRSTTFADAFCVLKPLPLMVSVVPPPIEPFAGDTAVRKIPACKQTTAMQNTSRWLCYSNTAWLGTQL